MADSTTKNGNGTIGKIVTGLLILAIGGMGTSLWSQVREESSLGQARAERLRAVEVQANFQAEQLARIEKKLDRILDEIDRRK